MQHLFIVLAAAAADPETIVVTASREPVELEAAGVSADVIPREEIEALALPAAIDLLRLVPGVSVSASGPRGSQTQLRIRGAEANHSLLFVDGIRFNDPAAGNEARFELLTSDALSRIEVVRGPQSALWGSEALGGVIAADTADPRRERGFSLLGEYGSLKSARASASFAAGSDSGGVSGSAGWLRSEGVDAFGRGGERDGFDNRSASLKGVVNALPNLEIGIVGHHVEGTSEFDGFDPASFRRADTLDETRNRISAVRSWGMAKMGDWSVTLDGAYLDSANRNRVGATPLNSTFGNRFTAGAEVSRTIAGHRLTAAAEHQKEEFRARDQVFFGGTDQDRSRNLTAFVGEWRAEWSPLLTTDLAVRHDSFSEFADATTFRGTVLVRPVEDWTLHAAYGEGIAQPTFYDLFGFFPGSFRGNPGLRPESSRGWEAGLRWGSERSGIGATAFSNRLKDEIVDVFEPATFTASTANATGRSRRRGLELDARYALSGFDLRASYTYLDSEQRQVAGSALVREVRRPRHSAALSGHGSLGPVEIGGSLAYVGERRDTDFEAFPARTVTLNNYLLGSLKVGWRVSEALEAYVRAENLFDAQYEDAFGYNTAGRTIHAGLRARLGR